MEHWKKEGSIGIYSSSTAIHVVVKYILLLSRTLYTYIINECVKSYFNDKL